MKFETLSLLHVNRLFEFELKNKAWFESMIEPRSECFYSNTGVLSHVNMLLTDMEMGKGFNAVITKDDAIIARANLKNIKHGCAEVGFRVSSENTGQGVGSFCLTVLMDCAKELNLKQLNAFVLENNIASKRVLEKQGFVVIDNIKQYLRVNNEVYDCWVLQKNLDNVN